MKLKDLKDGMIVEIRNGRRFLVLGKNLIREKSYFNRSDIRDDLKDKCFDDYDIMKVYKSTAFGLNHIFEDENLEMIWERKLEFDYYELIEVRDSTEDSWTKAYFLGFDTENNGLSTYQTTIVGRDIFEGYSETNKKLKVVNWVYARKIED